MGMTHSGSTHRNDPFDCSTLRATQSQEFSVHEVFRARTSKSDEAVRRISARESRVGHSAYAARRYEVPQTSQLGAQEPDRPAGNSAYNDGLPEPIRPPRDESGLRDNSVPKHCSTAG
jgi:hypothetical protein